MSGLVEPLTKNHTVWKSVATAAATTIAVWTPVSSTRIALTGLSISSFGANTSTVSVFFSTSLNTPGTNVGVFSLSTTSVVNVLFPGLEHRYDVPLNAVSTASAVNITAYGFELA